MNPHAHIHNKRTALMSAATLSISLARHTRHISSIPPPRHRVFVVPDERGEAFRRASPLGAKPEGLEGIDTSGAAAIHSGSRQPKAQVLGRVVALPRMACSILMDLAVHTKRRVERMATEPAEVEAFFLNGASDMLGGGLPGGGGKLLGGGPGGAEGTTGRKGGA